MTGLEAFHESSSSPQGEVVLPSILFAPEDVRAQLVRIMVSDEFNRSPRLRRFLQFIIDESLSGRDGQIKAYSIGLAVCDRDEQFDPSIDPIVRIEAGRLRRALEHYYLTQGIDDPITIDVPKGAYRPVITKRSEVELGPNPSPGLDPRVLRRFLARASDSAEERSFFRRMADDIRPGWLVAALIVALFSLAVIWMDRAHERDLLAARAPPSETASELGIARAPILLVLPFHSDDGPDQSAVADFITDNLTQSLMRQADFNIRRVTNTTDKAADHFQINSTVDYVVSGSVRKIDDHLRVFVQLTNVGAQASIWSQVYDRDLNSDSIERQDDIASSIVKRLGSLSGRIAPAGK
jgi:TolB-like protein